MHDCPKLNRFQVPKCLFAFLLILAGSIPSQAASSAPQRGEYRTAKAILELSREEAAKGHPVKLTGQVCYFNRKWNCLFVRDSTGGVYILPPYTEEFEPGQMLEIEGRTDPGRFAPCIASTSIRVVGSMPIAPFRPVSIPELQLGAYDSQPVEVQGRVRAATLHYNQLRLELSNGGKQLPVFVKNYAGKAPSDFAEADVIVRAVCATRFNSSGQLLTPQLLVASVEDVVVLARSEPPEIPLKRINELLRYSPSPEGGRIKVRGTVLLYVPGEAVFVRDTTGSLKIRTMELLELAPGDRVEATGYPVPLEYGPVIDHGIVTVVGRGELPEPVPVTAADIFRGALHNELIRVRGTLLSATSVPELRAPDNRQWYFTQQMKLVLQLGDWFVTADLPNSPSAAEVARIRPGSVVDVTGVCAVEMFDRSAVRNFQLLMRTPDDIAVVAHPPWWSTENARKAMILFGLIGVAALGWITALYQKSQKRFVEAQRQADEKFHLLVDQAADALFIHDDDGRLIDANQEACRMLGYERHALLQLNIRDFETKSGSGGTTQDWRSLALGQKLCRTGRYKRRDGSVLPVELRLSPVMIDGRKLFVVVARDITERENGEKRLRESQALYHSLVESLPQNIFRKDSCGRFTFANQRFCEMLGKPFGEIVGKRDGDLFSQRLAEAYQRDDATVFATGRPLEKIEEHLLPNGQHIHVQVVKTPVYNAEGEIIGIQGIFWDVTERYELEKQLRHSQKMESVGRLAGGIAHDFNNILTVILGHASLMAVQDGLPQKVKDQASAISASAERASKLTRQLLMFSRQQPMMKKAIDLNRLVTDIARMVQRIVSESISIETALWDQPLAVQGDAALLEQVLVNLVVNARDAIGSSGRIQISTGRLERLPNVDSGGQMDGGSGPFACITIADTGSGIEPQNLPRIFDPFFTTKDLGKGTGLGLSIAYGIVKQHGGWISVDSAVGKGSTFRVALPLVDASAPAKEEGKLPALSNGSEVVLLVEDQPQLLDMMADLLTRHGYTVRTASCGPEALEVARAVDRIDLVVTDIVMPGGIDGFHLAGLLTEIHPGMRIIYTSGYSEEPAAAGIQLVPGKNYLPKPFQPWTFLRTVRECCDRPVTLAQSQ